MSDGIKLIIREGGVAEIYDDTYDLTIHCTSADEQREILRKMNEAFNPEKRTISQDHESDLLREINIGGLYRHFKGGMYRVTGFARHTETMEMLVIYENVEHCGKMWARPIAMFTEFVNGVKRFSYVGKITEVDNGRLDM